MFVNHIYLNCLFMPHILCNLYSLAFTEYRGELTGRHLSFTESAMNQLCQRNYVDTILVFNQTTEIEKPFCLASRKTFNIPSQTVGVKLYTDCIKRDFYGADNAILTHALIHLGRFHPLDIALWSNDILCDNHGSHPRIKRVTLAALRLECLHLSNVYEGETLLLYTQKIHQLFLQPMHRSIHFGSSERARRRRCLSLSLYLSLSRMCFCVCLSPPRTRSHWTVHQTEHHDVVWRVYSLRFK